MPRQDDFVGALFFAPCRCPGNSRSGDSLTAMSKAPEMIDCPMGRSCPTTKFGKHRPNSKELKEHEKLAKQSQAVLAALKEGSENWSTPKPKTSAADRYDSLGTKFAEETNLTVSRSDDGSIVVRNSHGEGSLTPKEADILGIDPSEDAGDAGRALNEAAEELAQMEVSDYNFSEMEYICGYYGSEGWDDVIVIEHAIASEQAGKMIIPVSEIDGIKSRVDTVSSKYGSAEERLAFQDIADEFISDGKFAYDGRGMSERGTGDDISYGTLRVATPDGYTTTVPWAGVFDNSVPAEEAFRDELADMIGAVYYANQDEPYDAVRRMEQVEGRNASNHEQYEYLRAAKKVSDVARPLIDEHHESY